MDLADIIERLKASAELMSGLAAPLRTKTLTPTLTEKFYSVTQRMPLKTLAMKAWSGAVLDAYLKAGGVWPPRPYDVPIKTIYRTKRSAGS
jgi:hypothetical protein